ncbi:MAG: hypothetical protein ACPGWR_18285 [Ardenticatenaceae bacterium]
MTRFLFWNLNRKPLQSLIATLAVQHEVDVLIFAECSIEPNVLLQSLREAGVEYHYLPSAACKKIEMFTRLAPDAFEIIIDLDRRIILQLNLPEAKEILLAATHFPSKVYWDDASQAAECVELIRDIRATEQKVGHSRTILVGDLNMNPFESGIVNANALNAVMSQTIARRGFRVIQGTEFPFFYNPMWSFFGDLSPGPPGTYYYAQSVHKNFFWNMFDQVLIRPDLLSSFSDDDLQILTTIGNTSLLTKTERPNVKVASDHLPLLLTLDL